MRTFFAFLLMTAVAMGAVPSQTDFDSTYFKTSSLPISVTGNLTNWQKLSTNVVSSTAMTGTVSNNVASAGLLSVDATKTNGIAATAAHIISTLGFTPANSNSVPASANPTATVATTAVNGSATTFMRSDASPAIPASFIQSNQTNVAAANPTATVSTSAVNGSAATFMRSDAAFAVPASFITANQTNVAAANPTASIGASVVNGSAATFMRSDAAPALASGAATNNIGYVPVNKAGDSMTGTLSVTGFTNSARSASTFVVSAADKSDASSAASSVLAATLTDETGSGVAVFGTSPTFTTSLTITNSVTGTTALTVNGPAGPSVDLIDAAIGGLNVFKVDNVGALTTYGKITSGSTVLLQGGLVVLNVTGFGGELQLGLDAASPVAQVIKGCNGSGTDKAGASLALKGGQSTGTGTGGLLDISTALTGEASGSTANAYSIRAHYKPKFVALTHTTATTIETFSLAANKLIGGTATVTCYATNSTPHLQALTSTLIFQAVAVSTTITATLSQVDGTTAADSGTLTCTYTIADNGDNTFSIKANANSSLSSPTERAKVVITALNGNAAITITDP